MRIKLYSHIDLDGISTYILLKYYYQNATISYNFCNYNDINEKIKKFLDTKEYLNYDYIYITDISISEELAEKLQKIANEGLITIKLFDHHGTAMNLNKFDFCNVISEQNNELVCGTKLFYNYLISEKKLEEKNFVSKYVKYVNDYDTWLWETKYHYELPNEWNTLLQFYGRLHFIENVLKKFERNTIEFTETDRLIIDTEYNKKKSYIKNKMKEAFEKEIDGYKCIIVFAEQYSNDIATALKEYFPNTQIQIIIGSNGISYRRRNNVDVNLGEFVKQFGGGGHPTAAGSPITKNMKKQWLDLLFT